jgi:HPt (histidine-containing phosphotransfer) domain-containing protein
MEENKKYDLSIPMEASDDPEYLKEISNYFVTNSSEMLVKLGVAIDAKDWEQAQYFSHKLSSNFYMFGLKEGGDCLLQIEHSLMANEGYEKCSTLYLIARRQGDEAIKQLKIDFDL